MVALRAGHEGQVRVAVGYPGKETIAGVYEESRQEGKRALDQRAAVMHEAVVAIRIEVERGTHLTERT